MSPLRILVFVAVVAVVLGGGHYYLWARLVRDTELPAPWAGLARGLLVGLAVAVLVGIATVRSAPRAVSSPLMWVVYLWFGLFFFLLVLTGTVDLIRAAVGLAQTLGGVPPPDTERRMLLARVAGAAVGVGAVGLGVTGIANVLRPLAVKRVQVRLAKLPDGFAGYRIVQITDVHVGPTIGKAFIESLVEKVNALQPDAIAITGDLVDGSVSELGPLVAPLAKLEAKDGVYFVTGNHEYYSGVDEWLAFLKTLGIRSLRNERVAVGGPAGFDLAGIDDAHSGGFGRGHGPDLARAVAGRDPSRALVLLAHQPTAIDRSEELGVDLQLSGHTHGGQIFPWSLLVRIAYPYIAGLYARGRTQVYVSSGTGYWGPPMRIGTAAEVTQIDLLRA